MRASAGRALLNETDDAVTFRVPRRFIEQLATAMGTGPKVPITVDQRTCEQHIGISRRQYLEACRAGAFPYRVESKRRVALTADVERYWTRDLSTDERRRARVSSAAAVKAVSEPSANDTTVANTEEEVAARVRQQCRLIPID